MCHADRVSAPPDQTPRDDRTAIAIAWAVAAVVVALAAAFIAWLALGNPAPDGTSSPQTSSAAPETAGAAEEPATGDTDEDPDAQPGQSESEEPTEQTDPGATEQTPSPEVAQMLLDLQRRDADDTMAVGDVDAPVVMIEYADYRCPYCAQFHLEIRPDLLPLVEDGTLRIEFRDFVIFEETSELAAVAGRAAAAQGHLEDYQSAVFALSTEGHAEFDAADLVDLAEEVGVPDLEQFESDLQSDELLQAVRADTEEATSLGVGSTPTFLINTQVLQGAYPADRMRTIIESEAAVAQE